MSNTSIVLNQGENLDLAIFKEEVVALIGDGVCSVKTLTHNHLYCEPPSQQPSVMASKKQEGMDSLPEFTVRPHSLGHHCWNWKSEGTCYILEDRHTCNSECDE